ncbi:fibronectin type III domain-containing protein [Natrinema salinisoli]|uniref:fibronectin type III domain-containing protein n=1 Tax=Natrinema salinisoli TaxID=2878535 RepID=UPI001CF01264|nr:PKD domain-containing protein [Natrinema salinisoli]
MTNDNNTYDDAQLTDQQTDSSASRRTFMQAAGASAGALAVGTSTVAADDHVTLSADLADDQIGAGETTTVTFSISNGPTGVMGWGLEATVDSAVAEIVGVTLGDEWPSNWDDRNSVDEPTDSFRADYAAFRQDGGVMDVGTSEYEFATFVLEAQEDGTTDVELSDFLLTDAEDEAVAVDYETPTLRVGDDPSVPDMPADLAVVDESETSVEVEWSPVPDALEYAVSVDGEQELTTTSSSATITGLEADTTYDIGVSAVGEGETASGMATVQATTVAGSEPETPTVTVDLADAQVDPGQTTTVDIGMTAVPNGLSGFELDIDVNTEAAIIVDAEIGETFADSLFPPEIDVTDGSATVAAAGKRISEGTTDLDLATVELEGVADGETVVDVAEGNTPMETLPGNDGAKLIEPKFEEAMLTVGDGEPDEKPPSVPEDLEVVAETETSIEVAWATDPNADEYAVYVDGEQETTTTATSATVTDLESGTTYQIGVSAIGGEDTETDPATISATTAEANTPPSTPEGLEVVAENETSIEVAWDSDPNAVEYNVWARGEETLTTTSTSITVPDLESGTTYDINVSAVGEEGTETDPATVSATTAEPHVPPSTPEGLEVVAENETSIEVAWSSDPNAVEYVVSVDGTEETTTSSTSATVTDLEAETTYEIGVSAVGEEGTETDPATVSATTAGGDDGDNEDGGDSEYPEWDANTLYQSGERVHWNGEDWEARWTNQGTEPKYEENYAWEPVDGEIPLEVDHLAKIDPSATDVETGERIGFHVRDDTPGDIWITGLEWDLGDGTSVSGWYAGHSYESSGTYTVTLTATDQRGRQTTHDVEITVS